eukprot:4173782-Pleurochrysis_carterae.AAC.1
MRAINQAVGRVIRHAKDFGVVLLCESRFRQQRYVDGLSLWLRRFVVQFSGFGEVIQTLPKFFKRAMPALAANQDAIRPTASMETSAGKSHEIGGSAMSRVADAACTNRAPLMPIAPTPAPSLMHVLQSTSRAAACPIEAPLLEGEIEASVYQPHAQMSALGGCAPVTEEEVDADSPAVSANQLPRTLQSLPTSLCTPRNVNAATATSAPNGDAAVAAANTCMPPNT